MKTVTVFAPYLYQRSEWHDERISPEANDDYGGSLWPYFETLKSNMCPVFKNFARSLGDTHPGHNTAIPIVPQYAFSQNDYLGSDKGV